MWRSTAERLPLAAITACTSSRGFTCAQARRARRRKRKSSRACAWHVLTVFSSACSCTMQSCSVSPDFAPQKPHLQCRKYWETRHISVRAYCTPPGLDWSARLPAQNAYEIRYRRPYTPCKTQHAVRTAHLALEIARVPGLAQQFPEALHQRRAAPRIVGRQQEKIPQRRYARQRLQAR